MEYNEIKNNWNKIYFIIYNLYNKFIIINIINKNLMFPNFLDEICTNKKNKTMTKLSLMISHMSFMTDEWNVPYHVLKDNVDGMAFFLVNFWSYIPRLKWAKMEWLFFLFIFGPIFQG
jgi:hypothetical protein